MLLGRHAMVFGGAFAEAEEFAKAVAEPCEFPRCVLYGRGLPRAFSIAVGILSPPHSLIISCHDMFFKMASGARAKKYRNCAKVLFSV
jgi:hypothetical protein